MGENKKVSELYDLRVLFTSLLPMLFDKMISDNKHPMIGADGLKHMEGSLHFDGLAVDIILSVSDEKILESTEDHRPYGEYWKSLHPYCRWGGDFRKSDGNHYSITFQGKA